MRQVNTLFHFTNKLSIIESILKEGFKPSYSVEKFGQRNILVPMVSFMNVLLRDVGPNEVVDYGDYGIGINREFATTIGLNPVCYVYDKSVIDEALQNLHNLSILPQQVDIIKESLADKLNTFSKVTDYIKFSPKPILEVENLINSIDKKTDEKLVKAIKNFATKTYENAYYQLLLAKPYKVFNKRGETKIAYNEREWRKGYPELGYIHETDAKGVKSKLYEKWIQTNYPHFNEEKYRLKIEIQNISHIIVKDKSEFDNIKKLLLKYYEKNTIEKQLSTKSLKIGTIDQLKEK